MHPVLLHCLALPEVEKGEKKRETKLVTPMFATTSSSSLNSSFDQLGSSWLALLFVSSRRKAQSVDPDHLKAKQIYTGKKFKRCLSIALAASR